MKRVKILSISLAFMLVATVFAGCASPAAAPPQETKTAVSEKSQNAQESVMPESGMNIEDTQWAMYKTIQANGDEIKETDVYEYQFGKNNEVTEVFKGVTSNGTYEVSDNIVTITIGEKVILGTIENDELSIFEGKGAHVFKQK